MVRFSALYARFERRDSMLLVAVAGLIGISLVTLAFLGEPASAGVSSPMVRQGIAVVIGLALYWFLAHLDYHDWSTLGWLTYGLALALLVLVLMVGVERGGSQRWFILGDFQFQPSEFAKIALIVVLARYYTRAPYALSTLRGHLLAGIITLPAALLVLRQPDLGTALLLIAIWQGIALAGGVNWRHLAVPPAVALAASPAIWFAMQPYMRERILAFFDPSFDPLGSGYNVLQARIAIGSGGLWGRGFSESSQTALEFLRVRETDFIFAVIAEQAGLIGSLVVIGLFGLLVTYALVAGISASDRFGSIVAIGVMVMFTVQVTVNVGMNVGILPVTGLTLPLISAGGSSMIAMLGGLGLVTSISHNREFGSLSGRRRLPSRPLSMSP